MRLQPVIDRFDSGTALQYEFEKFNLCVAQSGQRFESSHADQLMVGSADGGKRF